MTTCGACSCNWSKPTQEAERVTELIRLLHNSAAYTDQTKGRNGITGQQHALRCAALAGRHAADPCGEEALLGLVHDLARPLNDVHHGEIIAEIVRDRVSAEAYQVLRTHGSYQTAIVHGTGFPIQPWSARARTLAAQELASFSTNYSGPEMSLQDAETLIRTWLG